MTTGGGIQERPLRLPLIEASLHRSVKQATNRGSKQVETAPLEILLLLPSLPAGLRSMPSASTGPFPSNAQLIAALPRYRAALTKRQQSGGAVGAKNDLVDLDEYVWTRLTQRLRERRGKASTATSASTSSKAAANPDASGGWLQLDELKEVMRWKLARGKFRPTLPGLIASNSDAAVKDVTSRGLAHLGAEDKDADGTRALKAMTTLCELKGVGPATASLILSLANEHQGFMSDESWLCLEALSGRKVGYTPADWKRWRSAFQGRLEQWQKEDRSSRDARSVEKACWAWKNTQTEEDEPVGDDVTVTEAKPQGDGRKRKRQYAAEQDPEGEKVGKGADSSITPESQMKTTRRNSKKEKP